MRRRLHRSLQSALVSRSALVWLGVALVLGAGCGSGGDSAPRRPQIVVTTGIWADVVANLDCSNQADIETIIPPGADPHAFEPSLGARARMDAADLIVVNGRSLEEGLADTIDAASRATPVFAVAEHVAVLDAGDEEHHSGDPHVWMDPIRVSGALSLLADRLVADAGLDELSVGTCLGAYQSELAALDAEIAAEVAGIPEADRRLVTNHDALGYFADRYGFEVIGTVIPAVSTLAESSPGQLQALGELVETTGTPAIFTEFEHSSADAEAVAAAAGDVELVPLFTGSLGEAGSGAETYLGLLRTDARLITEALITDAPG